MTKLTQKEATELIAAKLEEAAALIKECEKLANKAGVGFSSPLDHYSSLDYRPAQTIQQIMEDVGAEDEEELRNWYDEDWIEKQLNGGWFSSSDDC